MLHSLAEAEQADKAGTTVVSKVKSVLNEEPFSPYEKQQRKSQIARMTRELHQRTKLAQLRDKTGILLTEPTSIARALQDHWSNIMKKGPKTSEEGIDFLDSLPLPRTLRNCAPY